MHILTPTPTNLPMRDTRLRFGSRTDTQEANVFVTSAQLTMDEQYRNMPYEQRMLEAGLAAYADRFDIMAGFPALRLLPKRAAAFWHNLRKHPKQEEQHLRNMLAFLENRPYKQLLKMHQVLRRLAHLCEAQDRRREAALLRERAMIYHPSYGLEGIEEQHLMDRTAGDPMLPFRISSVRHALSQLRRPEKQ